MKSYWIFPALLGLMSAVIFHQEHVHWLLIILCFLLMLRLLRLRSEYILIVSCLAALLTGIFHLHHRQLESSLEEGPITETFILQNATVKIDGAKLKADIIHYNSGQKYPMTYYFKSEAEKDSWIEATEIQFIYVEGELQTPRGPRYLGAFDYQNYLKNRKIFHTLRASEIHLIDQEMHWSKANIFDWIYAKIKRFIQLNQPETLSELSLAVLFADRSNLSQDQMKSYKNIGLMHLLSVSGLHILVFAQLMKRFLLKIQLTISQSEILASGLLVAYGCLVAWPISVFRAVSQYILKSISRHHQIGLTSLDCWSLTLILALILFPGQYQEAGFQLSFGISFALILSSKWSQKSKHPIFNQLCTSLLCLVISAPILSYHFFEFSVIGLFANLIFLPIFSYMIIPILIIGFLISMFSLIIPSVAFLNEILNFLLDGFQELVNLFSHHFELNLITGRPYILAIILYLMLWIMVMKRLESGQKIQWYFPLLMLACLMSRKFSPYGVLAMIDVGQGDSMLIKTPFNQEIILVDTGGKPNFFDQDDWQNSSNSFSIGESIVVPCLKYFGINRIDELVITHADADHSGEILQIQEHLPIQNILATKQTLQDDSLADVLQKYFLDHGNLTEIIPPQKLHLFGGEMIFLAPKIFSGDRNRDSVISLLTIDHDKWLLMGDADQESERALLNNYPKLKADYLKIGHHGSHTSTNEEFLKQIKPKAALISVGRNNRYNHPSIEVIELLERFKIQIYRTDQMGTIYYFYSPFRIRKPMKDEKRIQPSIESESFHDICAKSEKKS